MKINNKKYIKNRGLIQITLGNKKKWIGEIIFLNNIKKLYFILPFYSLSIFKLKIIIKNFETIYTYNENDILFDQNLILKIEKNLSFSNFIKDLKQKKNKIININNLKNLKYSIVVPFSNALFLKDKKIPLLNTVDYKLKMNIFKKSGFNLVEIKKLFLE